MCHIKYSASIEYVIYEKVQISLMLQWVVHIIPLRFYSFKTGAIQSYFKTIFSLVLSCKCLNVLTAWDNNFDYARLKSSSQWIRRSLVVHYLISEIREDSISIGYVKWVNEMEVVISRWNWIICAVDFGFMVQIDFQLVTLVMSN
jgi:hypothetical protein